MTRQGVEPLLSRSHVSSMTGGYTYQIYHQRVENVYKGSVIIRDKKKQMSLAKKVPEEGLGWGVEPCCPAAMFQP